MPEEAVFYFDVLGFRSKAGGSADEAIDALTALADILSTSPLTDLAGDGSISIPSAIVSS